MGQNWQNVNLHIFATTIEQDFSRYWSLSQHSHRIQMQTLANQEPKSAHKNGAHRSSIFTSYRANSVTYVRTYGTARRYGGGDNKT